MARGPTFSQQPLSERKSLRGLLSSTPASQISLAPNPRDGVFTNYHVYVQYLPRVTYVAE